jgi:hypothetical protein
VECLPEDAQPPAADGGGYELHKWDNDKLASAIEDWKDSWFIDGDSADDAPLTIKEKALAAGPPTTYYRQESITIGAQRFQVTKGDVTDLKSIRDSTFLRNTFDVEGRLFFWRAARDKDVPGCG